MQKPAQDILKHKRAEIADVREIVDRGAAGVDADFALVQRLERLKAVRKRVVQDVCRSFSPQCKTDDCS